MATKKDVFPFAYYGKIIHSAAQMAIEYIEKGLIVVDEPGMIIAFYKNVTMREVEFLLSEYNIDCRDASALHILPRKSFLMPGLIDTHNHAPQWSLRGTRWGSTIGKWLLETGFRHESRFEDVEYARKEYSLCVDGVLKQGTTTACYYGTLHSDATKILADICKAKGQRALIGKCNMNFTKDLPSYYREDSVEEALESTKEFIAYVRSIDPDSSLITPVLTPRSAILCTEPLLKGLGEIAKVNPDIPIQTHFSVDVHNVRVARARFPKFRNEGDIYSYYGLMTNHSIFAHCLYPTDYEMALLKSSRCGISHCPVASINDSWHTTAPIRRYLDKRMKVGFGTESGGGNSASILEAMRYALVFSEARGSGRGSGLKMEECLYIATVGGAAVCGLSDKVGSFDPGLEFDALEVCGGGNMTPIEDTDSMSVMLEKLILTGDDRNFCKVYVQGRCVKG